MIEVKFNTIRAGRSTRWLGRVAGSLISLLVLDMIAVLAPMGAQAAPVTPFNPGAEQLQILSESPAVLAFGGYTTLVNAGLHSNSLLRLEGKGYQPPRWSGNWADFGLFSALPHQFSEPFNSLSASWAAEVPEGTGLEVDVRVSPDNHNWTLWQILDQSGQTANFGADNAFLYAQYRVRLFSQSIGQSPTFYGVRLEANRRSLNEGRPDTIRYFSTSNIAAASADAAAPPTYNVHATREGLVGYRTANGHIIQPRDRFVSLPSWTALNDLGKSDYRVRIVTPSGRSAVAPVWDVGPWNFKDNYWHNPRNEFKDLPVGVPQAEKAFYNKHNGGLNESGVPIYNPSGIDIADGIYWDDLGLKGAQDGRVDVTFLWEGALPSAASMTGITAGGAWHNGVVIKWNSSTPTNSWVEYGLNSGYGQRSWVDNRMVGAHERVLTDLVPGQTYHYRVHGKDIYGSESTSGDFTFQTLPGLTTPLSGFQKDSGLALTVSKDQQSVQVYGARTNPSYWNDNPKEDFVAGARTAPNALAETGNLDLDLAPFCDEKGENCSMGFGSGFKNFVRFSNARGETFEIGLIHDLGISPNSLALMIEGNLGQQKIRLYGPPDSVDQKKSHHLHFFWWENKLLLIFDYGQPQVFNFNSEGLMISFTGAGRAKDDVVAAHFNNIAFSPNAFTPTKS